MSTADDRDPLLNDDRLLRRSLTPTEAAAGACLDAETLAAWADGAMQTPGAEEAEEIERHLASCARCQGMLAAFANAEAAEAAHAGVSAQTPPGRQSKVLKFQPAMSRWIPIALGAVAASLVLYAAWPKHGTSIVDRPAQTMASSTPAAPPSSTTDARPIDQSASANAQQAGAIADRKLDKPASARSGGFAMAQAKAAPTPAAEPLRAPAPVAPPVGTPTTTTAGLPKSQLNVTIDGIARTAPPVATGAAGAVAAKPPELTLLRSAGDEAKADAAALRIVAEFSVPTTPTPAASQSLLGRGAGAGGGGRGGGGGVAGGGIGGLMMSPRPVPRVSWHVLASGQVERSINGGQTWTPVTITPAAPIVNGAAPSANVCWLIGRTGIVLLSTDGATFRRVNEPVVADLRSITAIDEMQATVTTVDGRIFTTEDGGDHWKEAAAQGFPAQTF